MELYVLIVMLMQGCNEQTATMGKCIFEETNTHLSFVSALESATWSILVSCSECVNTVAFPMHDNSSDWNLHADQ